MATAIPRIEQLSSRVIRILGCNPGPFQLQGTNSYLVGTGRRRILIDTSDRGHSEYLSSVQTVLSQRNVKLQEIILTHWHHDHIGAVRELCQDVFKERVKVNKMKRIRLADMDLAPEADYSFLNGDETISTQGASLRVIPTPGHSEDHISLLLEEENAIFSGDCVLGEGTTVFEDLFDYMESMNKLKELKPTKIYPGHGPVVNDAVSRLTEYIDHRNMREGQLVELLRAAEKWVKPMDLVKQMYQTTPVELHKAALGNVLHHLGKLLKEGKVEIDQTEDAVLSVLRGGNAEGSCASTSAIQNVTSANWRWKTHSQEDRDASKL